MKSEKGIILIFVLMVLAAFSLLGAGLSFRARIENRLAGYYETEQENLYLVKMKLKQVMNVIACDDNTYDSLDEDWALRELMDLEDGGTLSLSVEDEDGKLDLNNAGKEWLSNFFRDDEIAARVLAKRPFFIREDLLPLEELQKGVDFKKSDMNVLDLVTAHRHDKMNINTVREEVLRSLPGFSPDLADAILSLRNSEPISSMEGLNEAAGIDAADYQAVNNVFKTSSDYYAVRIETRDGPGGIVKSFRIILKKDPNTASVEIIRWLEW